MGRYACEGLTDHTSLQRQGSGKREICLRHRAWLPPLEGEVGVQSWWQVSADLADLQTETLLAAREAVLWRVRLAWHSLAWVAAWLLGGGAGAVTFANL